ncbi:MAG: hypothetical protein ACMUEM_01570 [Flavobacteriales bacterium AspAUS03]
MCLSLSVEALDHPVGQTDFWDIDYFSSGLLHGIEVDFQSWQDHIDAIRFHMKETYTLFVGESLEDIKLFLYVLDR